MNIKRNADNIETLVDKIVDDWDLNTLVGYAKGMMAKVYELNEEAFLDDWYEQFPDAEEESE